MGASATARRRLVAGDDLAVVAGQLGRRPHDMSRVVRRCPFGYPAVVETWPCDARGRPFPTLFYATCPTLVAAVGAVESGGGVRRFERLLREEPDLARSVLVATRQTRRRRRYLVAGCGLSAANHGASRAEDRGAATMLDGGASLRTGIGGVSDPQKLKCLHAHAAHALAHPGYALGEAVLAEAGELWCDDRRCAGWTSGSTGDAAARARRSTGVS